MKGKLLFLGTGSSVGVPIIGCKCAVCQSNNRLNKRLRPSALVTFENKRFLIDVGPDFRQQALTNQISDVDGILFTHSHYDHSGGIDELRVLAYLQKKPLPILLSNETYEDIKKRFFYLFPPFDKGPSKFDIHLLPSNEGSIQFEESEIRYISYVQANMLVNGFCFGSLAYLSDIREFSPSIFDHLRGIDTLVISALRYESTALHFSVEEAIYFINKVGAKRAWLTHLSHDIDHEGGNALLPPHIRLAYDGLEIEFGN